MNLTCAWCGKVNTCHNGSEPGLTPKPGDVLICWTCARLSIMSPLHQPRRPTHEEQTELDLDSGIIAARSAMLRHRDPHEAVNDWRSTT